MKAGPRNGVKRRRPRRSPLERALRGAEHDGLARERVLRADDERAGLDGAEHAAAALLSGWGIGAHRLILTQYLGRAKFELPGGPATVSSTTTGLVAIGVQPSLSTRTTRTRAGRGIRTSPSET